MFQNWWTYLLTMCLSETRGHSKTLRSLETSRSARFLQRSAFRGQLFPRMDNPLLETTLPDSVVTAKHACDCVSVWSPFSKYVSIYIDYTLKFNPIILFFSVTLYVSLHFLEQKNKHALVSVCIHHGLPLNSLQVCLVYPSRPARRRQMPYLEFIGKELFWMKHMSSKIPRQLHQWAYAS